MDVRVTTCGVATLSAPPTLGTTNVQKYFKIRWGCGDENNPVALHFRKAGHNLSSLRYVAIEKVERPPRGRMNAYSYNYFTLFRTQSSI